MIFQDNVIKEYLKNVYFITGTPCGGKTTVSRLAARFWDVTKGKVTFGGEDISGYSEKQLSAYRAQKIGFIFQFYNILPSLTVLENVELVREIVPGAISPAQALEAVGLSEHKFKFPAELSGGDSPCQLPLCHTRHGDCIAPCEPCPCREGEKNRYGSRFEGQRVNYIIIIINNPGFPHRREAWVAI